MIKKEGVALFFYFSVENGRRLCYNTKYCVMTLKGEVTMPEKEKEAFREEYDILIKRYRFKKDDAKIKSEA